MLERQTHYQDFGVPVATDAYVKELETKTLEAWIQAVSLASTSFAEVEIMEKSISWRITSPLRFGKKIAIKIREVGWSAGVRLGVERMQRKRLEAMRARR